MGEIREDIDVARCKSCGARIVWAVTPNGKRMPIDADPAERGNLVVFVPEGVRFLDALECAPVSAEKHDSRVSAALREGKPRYVSHFATCSEAEKHRRPHTRARV